jgi:hypothetical protein
MILALDELIASRRTWINDVLRPWCVRATRKELRLAELDWHDLAGKVDPEATLWAWAWSRFPNLVHPELSRLDETRRITITLRDGSTFAGYPDGRQSRQGQLVLVDRSPVNPREEIEYGPFSIDDVVDVRFV